MRFDVPKVDFSDQEKNIWEELNGVTDPQEFISITERFFQLRESGVPVSSLTSELISFEDVVPQMKFYEQNKKRALVHENFVTCMSKINKSLDEEKTT